MGKEKWIGVKDSNGKLGRKKKKNNIKEKSRTRRKRLIQKERHLNMLMVTQRLAMKMGKKKILKSRNMTIWNMKCGINSASTNIERIENCHTPSTYQYYDRQKVIKKNWNGRNIKCYFQ